jgi:hypothetical protein
MNKVPTAEEFLRDFKDEIGLRSQSSPLGSEGTEIEALIDFAKLHCEAQLKAIIEKFYDTYHTICEDGTTKGVFVTQKEALNYANELNNKSNLYHDWVKVVRLNGGLDKDSIIKAYNLNNIK